MRKQWSPLTLAASIIHYFVSFKETKLNELISQLILVQSRHISSINSFVSLNECKLTEIDRSLLPLHSFQFAFIGLNALNEYGSPFNAFHSSSFLIQFHSPLASTREWVWNEENEWLVAAVQSIPLNSITALMWLNGGLNSLRTSWLVLHSCFIQWFSETNQWIDLHELKGCSGVNCFR